MAELKNRYDFIYVFDVKDGNPNGDPDAGNLPRVDAETGQGIVTDVCLKRKVRNYIQNNKPHEKPYKIFVRSKDISSIETFMNGEIDEAYKELNIDLQADKDLNGKKREKKGKAQGMEVDKGRIFMCENYYDIRTFGAVLSTGANAGQVRGPIQITFARSIDPIIQLEHTITVCAARDTDKSFDSQVGIQGRKTTVPYGVYVAYGFVSANLAKQTKFSEEDLELFWKSLINLFSEDIAASKGLMSAQKLYIFKHNEGMGNVPANKLFDLITPLIKKKDENKPARDFSDYQAPKKEEIKTPEGVTLIDDKI